MKVVHSDRNKSRQEENLLNGFFSLFKRKNLLVLDVIPYKRITKGGYLVDKEDGYQAFLKVRTTDLITMNTSDLNRMVDQFTNLLRIYNEPFKILSMTNLTETSEQQIFWKEKRNKYRREILSGNLSISERKRMEKMYELASEALGRMVGIEENLTELNFYIVVYGKNEKEMQIRIRDMVRLGGRQLQLRHVNNQKELEKIIFRLNNMNTEN